MDPDLRAASRMQNLEFSGGSRIVYGASLDRALVAVGNRC